MQLPFRPHQELYFAELCPTEGQGFRRQSPPGPGSKETDEKQVDDGDRTGIWPLPLVSATTAPLVLFLRGLPLIMPLKNLFHRFKKSADPDPDTQNSCAFPSRKSMLHSLKKEMFATAYY